MQLNGSEILIEVLVEQGVDTIFGYPGGAVLNIYDALYKNSDRIHHIITAHEQGASHAADGYARATGKTGVCLATSGPGATNLVTGIATAYMDSVPMVAITGNVGNPLIGKDSFQEVYITGITMPITKHNFMVRDVSELADILRDAFRIANTGRPGPVLVDIPKDVTGAVCEFSRKPVASTATSYTFEPQLLQDIADLINHAERPVIYYGGGVTIADAGDDMLALMRRAKIPATGTMMAIGALPSDEPLNLGLVGMHGWVSSGRAVDEADVLITIGARFSDRVATNPSRFATRARIIHVDIDAAEINKNINIDFAVVSDAKSFLTAILPYIKESHHQEWIQKIDDWRARLDYRPKDSETTLKPHRIMDIIVEATDDETIMVTDVGQHQMWAMQYCRRNHPHQFISSGGLGTMGFGYGAAIGAQIACPDKRVIHITGDGSFHMNLNELCTSVKHNLPIITVIMDNQVLGMVRQWQTMFYEKRYSSTTMERRTDYVKLAEAFGGHGFRCVTPEEFQQAMQQALTMQGPVVIDCLIDRDERVLPMIAAGATINDVVTM
ncbi:MAG: biosynthetic-type acetolactate synthase large subunit [Intestinibacillus sp.]